MTVIFGVRLDNRTQSAMDFQKVLTEFGCIIKTRLGLHTVDAGVCAPNGIIIIEAIDDQEAVKLESELKKIENIEVQTMKFQ